MVGFSDILDTGWVEDWLAKLAHMIKNVNGKFDDYSISPKIRQFLLQGYAVKWVIRVMN